MLQIREAVSRDSAAINELTVDLGYKTVSQEIALSRIKKIVDSSSDNLLVFEEDNQVKGWLHFFVAHRVASDSFVEIAGLVVSERWRRKGIGRNLVEYAMKWAEENNLKIRVRCNTKREGAHLFYESLGFLNKKSQYIFEVSL